MSQDWIELSVRTAADPAEVLARLDDPLLPGAWQDDGVLHLYWRSTDWDPGRLTELRAVLAQLGESVSEEAFSIDRVPDRDWNEEWARAVEPVRVGRIVVRPSWRAVALDPGDVELVLDPKQAFGTGHHATTQLLMAWLQDVVTGGEVVLDLGTGSGILAMCAVRLGAGRVIGLDHDPVAIDCARSYAERNGFGDELSWQLGAAAGGDADLRVQLVLANLDRQAILECAATFAAHAHRGARLLMSGVLHEQIPEIREALAAQDVYIQSVREKDGWLALEATAPVSCEGGGEAATP